MSSPFYGNAFGGGMYGLGAGMYGGAGGMYGGMMGGGGGGPVSSLNQFLFGIQNVIFSLSQAVQIIGMNTEAVKHLLESATVMFDHAVATWRELHALEAEQRQTETPEARKRRRRLRALRWALLVGVSYAGYQLVRKLVGATANALLRQQPQRRPLPAQAASESSSSSLLLQAPHYPPTASATVANSRFFF